MSSSSDIEKYQQQLTEYRRELLNCLKIAALAGINTPYEVTARKDILMEKIETIQLELQKLGVEAKSDSESQ